MISYSVISCSIAYYFCTSQAICDSRMIFLDVVCKWPGSCHEFFMLRQSNIHDQFESGRYGNSFLLGGSGYPLKSWLMTPISTPSNSAEERYNIAHKKTRTVVEG